MKKFLIISIILLSLSCSKNNSCQTWEYQDQCIPKNNNTQCANYGAETSLVCGQDLKDAQSGKNTVEHEDANATIVRHYIRRVN